MLICVIAQFIEGFRVLETSSEVLRGDRHSKKEIAPDRVLNRIRSRSENIFARNIWIAQKSRRKL